MWVLVARLPFDCLGFQSPREMLQVLRASLAARRLECRARRMVIPNCSGKPDVRLLLVAIEYRYMHRALTRLVSFLCWQTAQAWVQPRVHVYRQGEREKNKAKGIRAPIESWEIAYGIVYGDEFQRRSPRLGPHGPRDVAVREANFEFVRLGEIVRRLRRSEQRVTSLRPEKEESHAGLWSAIVGSLQ
jgi:hypothetical protein